MSLVIRSGHGLTMIQSACATVKEQIPLALALDAARIMIDSLEEASTRLEDKLISTSYKLNSLYSGTIQNVTDKEINSILSDTWLVIDTVHRLFAIIQKQFNFVCYKKGVFTEDFIYFKNSVAGIRNMFHHLDEKLEDYFVNEDNSDCVYGKLSWLFKHDDDLIECTIYTGILPNKGAKILRFSEKEEIKENGIFKYTVSYVEPIRKKGNNQFYYKEKELDVNMLVKYVNNQIDNMVSMCVNHLKILSSNGVDVDKLGHHLGGIGHMSPFTIVAVPETGKEMGDIVTWQRGIAYRLPNNTYTAVIGIKDAINNFEAKAIYFDKNINNSST